MSNSEQFNDVVGLRNDSQVQAQIVGLNSYGQTNVFFNPDLKLWASTNTYSSKDFAIILKGFGGHYLGVLFDGEMVETNTCQLKWVK